MKLKPTLSPTDYLVPSHSQEMEELKKRIRLLEAVVNNFPGGLMLFDSGNRLVLCNAQQRNMLDYPADFFAGEPPTLEDIIRYNAMRGEYGDGDVDEMVAARCSLVSKRVSHSYERERPNGTALQIRGEPLPEGGFVTTYLDVTEQKKSQQLVRHLAHHDSLTGLANRLLVLDRLEMALAGVRRGNQIALHYIDLDKFKPINDRHGHLLGDRVLKRVAKNLEKSVRETDTVARIGGDEFIVIQTDCNSVAAAELLGKRLLAAIREPEFLDDVDLSVSGSIGIAISPQDGHSTDELIMKADKAMYASKCKGAGNVSFYSQTSEPYLANVTQFTGESFMVNSHIVGDGAS